MDDGSAADRDVRMGEAGYWLHLIRAVEEAGRRLYLQGRLPGSFYDGRGQEARPPWARRSRWNLRMSRAR
jgi:TPP-dependent pyruvate/acetoin dehydrogenase alpha subunit